MMMMMIIYHGEDECQLEKFNLKMLVCRVSPRDTALQYDGTCFRCGLHFRGGYIVCTHHSTVLCTYTTARMHV